MEPPYLKKMFLITFLILYVVRSCVDLPWQSGNAPNPEHPEAYFVHHGIEPRSPGPGGSSDNPPVFVGNSRVNYRVHATCVGCPSDVYKIRVFPHVYDSMNYVDAAIDPAHPTQIYELSATLTCPGTPNWYSCGIPNLHPNPQVGAFLPRVVVCYAWDVDCQEVLNQEYLDPVNGGLNPWHSRDFDWGGIFGIAAPSTTNHLNYYLASDPDYYNFGSGMIDYTDHYFPFTVKEIGYTCLDDNSGTECQTLTVKCWATTYYGTDVTMSPFSRTNAGVSYNDIDISSYGVGSHVVPIPHECGFPLQIYGSYPDDTMTIEIYLDGNEASGDMYLHMEIDDLHPSRFSLGKPRGDFHGKLRAINLPGKTKKHEEFDGISMWTVDTRNRFNDEGDDVIMCENSYDHYYLRWVPDSPVLIDVSIECVGTYVAYVQIRYPDVSRTWSGTNPTVFYDTLGLEKLHIQETRNYACMPEMMDGTGVQIWCGNNARSIHYPHRDYSDIDPFRGEVRMQSDPLSLEYFENENENWVTITAPYEEYHSTMEFEWIIYASWDFGDSPIECIIAPNDHTGLYPDYPDDCDGMVVGGTPAGSPIITPSLEIPLEMLGGMTFAFVLKLRRTNHPGCDTFRNLLAQSVFFPCPHYVFNEVCVDKCPPGLELFFLIYFRSGMMKKQRCKTPHCKCVPCEKFGHLNCKKCTERMCKRHFSHIENSLFPRSDWREGSGGPPILPRRTFEKKEERMKKLKKWISENY